MKLETTVNILTKHLKSNNPDLPISLIEEFKQFYKYELLVAWKAGTESKENGKSFNTFYEETFKK